MVFAATGKQKGISVIADDTNVFVLLRFHYLAQKLSIPVVMDSPVKDRSAVDIRRQNKGRKLLIPILLVCMPFQDVTRMAVILVLLKAR